MYKLIFFMLLLFAAPSVAPAQSHQSGTGTVAFVPNGFRTVAEENALMEQVLADRKKKAAKEEGMPDNTIISANQKEAQKQFPKTASASVARRRSFARRQN